MSNLFCVASLLLLLINGISPALAKQGGPGIALNPAGSQAGQTQSPKFTSEYSSTGDLDICKPIRTEKLPGEDYIPQRCTGYGDYRLYKTATIEKVKGENWYIELLTVESMAGDFSVPLKRDTGYVTSYRLKIEWRLADGKPFACIARVYWMDNRQRMGEFLVVRGLKGYETIKGEVDVRKVPNANVCARELADAAYLQLANRS